jgi:acylphosphatase
MAEMAALHAIIHGRVQGVFFRASVADRATELNLNGYVRNRPGNVVEVRAEGETSNLEKLVEYLKVGPPAARVDNVMVTWGDHTGGFSSFRVR